MKERDKLIKDTVFSEEKYINTRIQSCLRRRFGYGWYGGFPSTLGDIVDLSEWEFSYMYKLGKKSREALFKTLEEHDLYFKKDSKLFRRNNYNELELLTMLKKKGLVALNKCDAEFFEEDCKHMGIIDECFNLYLDFLEEKRMQCLKPSQRLADMDKSNDELREIYDEIVDVKREEYANIIAEKRLIRERKKMEENQPDESAQIEEENDVQINPVEKKNEKGN